MARSRVVGGRQGVGAETQRRGGEGKQTHGGSVDHRPAGPASRLGRSGTCPTWYAVEAVQLTPPAPPPPPPPKLPAASADCETTVQLAQPGSLPQKMAYTMSRAADGKTRIDYGNTSVITDPNTQKMTILDHVAKE